ncbi:hypothetical protein ACHWQZ_G006107 [Mnemiopsis leidyi]
MSEGPEIDDKNINHLDYGNIPVVHISENSGEFLIPHPGIGRVTLKSDDLEQDIAARKIQTYWRRYQEQKLQKSFSSEDPEFTDEQYLSALIIQNHYRNHLSKKQLRERQQNAAQLIQYHYRQHLKRSEEKFEADLKQAAKITQENYSRLQMHEAEHNSISDKVEDTEEPSNVQILGVDNANIEAAIVIQRKYREHLKARQSVQTEKENIAAISIQRKYRRHLQLRQIKNENNAAISIQRQYRKRLILKRKTKQIEKENTAAMCIQRQFRKYQSERNTAAMKIQHKYRSHLQKKKHSTEIPYVVSNDAISIPDSESSQATKYSDDENIQENAARKIQKQYRQHYNKRVLAATSIQHQFKSSKSKVLLDFEEEREIPNQATQKIPNEKEMAAAAFIQKQYRAHVLRLSLENSVGTPHKNELKLPENSDIDSIVIRNEAVTSYTSPQNETLMDDSFQLSDEPIDETFSTNDGTSYLGYQVDWRNQLNKTGPDTDSESSPKAVPPMSKSIKQSDFHAKPSQKFDKIWPESKKSQHHKVKESPRKRQVQVSLDIKREQRRNEKNKRKDKFHLNNLRKQAPVPSSNHVEGSQNKQEILTKKIQENGIRPKQINSTKTKQESVVKMKQNTGVKNTKKRDTPQIQQEHSNDRELSEPELLQLRESSDEDSSPIDVHTEELEDTLSEPLEETTQPIQPAFQIKNRKRNPSNPGTNINIHHTRSSNNNESVRGSSETRDVQGKQDRWFPQSTRGDKIARRWSDQSSQSSGALSLIKVPLGSLDSYTVQNMLKRNDLLTRQFVFQKNDNHSYLQSYLKQMNLMNQPSGIVPKKLRNTRQREVCPRKNQPGLGTLPKNNLEKIAKYGRNSQPDNWKVLLENSFEGSPEPKGASRGNYYPVIPAYGKMKTDVSQKSSELSEIPWPSDIG